MQLNMQLNTEHGVEWIYDVVFVLGSLYSLLPQLVKAAVRAFSSWRSCHAN